MRWLVRLVVAGFALAAAAALALALLLPGLAASDAVRERVVEVVEEATARRFAYEELDAGLFPPRLELTGALLGDAPEPAARARTVSLRLAILPLLRRVLLVDALRVEGADVVLERTEHGVRLPGTSLRELRRDDTPGPRDAEAGEEGASFSFAVRGAALRDVRLRLIGPAGEEASVGPLGLEVRLSGTPTAPRGPFELDLSEGELRYGEAFHKPASEPATLRGEVALEDGSWVARDLELRLGSLAARGSLSGDPGRELVLDAERFGLGGLLAFAPGVDAGDVGGSASLEGLALRLEPLALAGRVRLDPLELGDFEGEPLVVRGPLVGEGTALRGAALEASLAGQRVPVELAILDLFEAPRVTLVAAAEGLDSDALVGALAGRPGLLSGPLGFSADLETALGGAPSWRESLAGRVAFAVAPGRLRGVSLLRGAVEAAGPVGGAALLAGRASGDERVDRFYEDTFESLAGSFDVAAGVARTRDLRLVYESYTVDLRGSLALADLGLDMTGQLTLDEELDAALAGTEAGRRRVIQLARVRGTIDEPRVVLSSEAIAMLASIYASDTRRREKWERKLDEELGEGAGAELLGILDQVLRGAGEGEGPPAPSDPDSPDAPDAEPE